MARNIPTTLDLNQFNSDDYSDRMPSTTTGSLDDWHMNDFEVPRMSEISEYVDLMPQKTEYQRDHTIPHVLNRYEATSPLTSWNSDKYQRDHTIPHVLNRYEATSPLTSWNSDREADSITTIKNVFAFDMRGKIEKSVKGKHVFIDALPGVLKQRLASMKGVLQDQVVFLNTPDNTYKTITYAAVLDASSLQNLTVFLKLDPEVLFSYRCINLPKDSGVEYLLDKLNLSQPSWPFLKGQRLQNTSSLFDQGVVCGDTIDLCKIRTETVKCLYRAAPQYEQLFTVECLTIDSIFELKQKIRETIRTLNRKFNSIPESVLNSHIWLTSGKRIYRNEEYLCLLESDLDSSSDSSDSQTTTYYDYILHFQPADYIPINVSYKVGYARFPTVETVIVPEQSSSTHLCEHISKLLSCLPTAVKLIIQGRKLPVSEDLSTVSDFKPGCMVHVSVKRAITVNVTMGDELLKFHVMKKDQVESLKCKIADKIKKLPLALKLKFKEKELVDVNRIEQEDIKDNCKINAELVEDRIQISIRKRRHPLTHVIVENLEETKIRDLKNYYRHHVRLSANLDIDLYRYNTCSQLDDFTTLKVIGIKDKEIFVASEKISAKGGSLMKIYEASHNGNTTIKFGMICNGMLLYSPGPVEPRTVTEDNHEDHAYSLPSTCCNIRIAQSFEVEPFEFSLTPEPLLHVQSPLSISPIPAYYEQVSISPIKPDYGPLALAIRPNQGLVVPQQQPTPLTLFQAASQLIIRQLSSMFISSTNTMMNRTIDDSTSILNTITDPPGVISNKQLQTLAKALPAHNWQFFIRDLDVLDAVISVHLNDNPRNVSEAIYKCLSDWKQREGNNAKTCIIQQVLHSHDLISLSQQLFGYETV